MVKRLVQWRNLELTLDGSQMQPLIREKIRESGAPVHDVEVRFSRGLMQITGKAKTFLTIPFQVDIREIRVQGRSVVIPIASVSAAGFPVPRLLSSLFEKSAADGAVTVDGAGPTVTVALDRFLPEFIDVELDEILIVDDGLLIRTGSGGADLPEGV